MSLREKSIFLALSPFIATVIFTSSCARTENTPLQYASSSSITFQVKEKLLRDPSIKSYPITVSTFKDTVTLGGYVSSHAQEERAIELTRTVKGVKYVVDNMAIKNA